MFWCNARTGALLFHHIKRCKMITAALEVNSHSRADDTYTTHDYLFLLFLRWITSPIRSQQWRYRRSRCTSHRDCSTGYLSPCFSAGATEQRTQTVLAVLRSYYPADPCCNRWNIHYTGTMLLMTIVSLTWCISSCFRFHTAKFLLRWNEYRSPVHYYQCLESVCSFFTQSPR